MTSLIKEEVRSPLISMSVSPRTALAGLHGSNTGQRAPKASSRVHSARRNANDENEPPPLPLASARGEKDKGSQQQLPKKKKRGTSGSATKRSGNKSDSTDPPTAHKREKDPTSSRQDESSSLDSSPCAVGELLRATLEESTAALALAEAGLRVKDEELLAQLQAIRAPLAAAAAHEQANEASEVALCSARRRLRVQPPNPLLAAVGAVRQRRAAEKRCAEPAVAPTVWSDAVVASLRSSLSAAYANNDVLVAECARLRRRVAELQAPPPPRARSKAKATATTAALIATPAPPLPGSSVQTPASSCASANSCASSADASQPTPEPSPPESAERANDARTPSELATPPVPRLWATPPLAPVRYSLLAGRPNDLLEAERVERAYQGQRNCAVAPAFGTAFGTPERHSAWQHATPREAAANGVADAERHAGCGSRWLEPDGRELSYRAFLERMEEAATSPQTAEQQRKLRSALEAGREADSPVGHPHRAQAVWSAKRSSAKKSAKKQCGELQHQPSPMPIIFSPRPGDKPAADDDVADDAAADKAKSADGGPQAFGFPKLADPFKILEPDAEGEDEDDEGEDDEGDGNDDDDDDESEGSGGGDDDDENDEGEDEEQRPSSSVDAMEAMLQICRPGLSTGR